MNKLFLDAIDIEVAARKLVTKLEKFKFNRNKTLVVGIGRGGLVAAQYVAYGLDIKKITTMQATLYEGKEKGDNIEVTGALLLDYDTYDNILLVDDLVDSGTTLRTLTELLDQVSDEMREDHAKDLNIIPCVLYTQESKKVSKKNGVIYGELLKKSKKGKNRWVEFPWDNFMDK